MQVTFLALTVLLLAVALFALQNAEPVTVRFLHWQVQASLALVTLSGAIAGALIAWLLGLAARLRRWRRARGAGRGPEPAAPDTPGAGPPPGPPLP